MRFREISLGGALRFLGLAAGLGLAATGLARSPNIVFILADDLGYGDIGPFGQEKIRTPSLDRMAREGMRFTQHYSGNAVCAPSRCVLMTGLHPGHAVVRNNREIKPEGQFPLPADTVTLPKLLRRAGYVTGAFGKWGLGGPDSPGAPLRQGFDRFYGYNCQALAHNFFPATLWSDERRVSLHNPAFSAHQALPADADANDPANYRGFTGADYSADLIAEQAREFVRANRARPFFLFWPSTVPHLALQVPEDSLREYLGQFPETPYRGGRYLPHYAPRAAYAAMITRFDREIGRMMDLVAELGLERETMFVFTSDNGALAQSFAGTDAAFFGSSGPFRSGKGSLHEGGVRVPLIVRWVGRIGAGATSERVTGFEDWLPTLLQFAGREDLVPQSSDGIGFRATLEGRSQPERPFLYREFPVQGGQQSVRIGDWKGIRRDLAAARGVLDSGIELYDLKTDVSERRDVAAQYPTLVLRMAELMRSQHTTSSDFPLPGVDRLAAGK